MPRVLVPLAEGFEEIEASTIIDVLRRAEIDVVVAGLAGVEPCRGSRGIVFVPDSSFDAVAAREDDFDLVVLPGGTDGTRRLAAHEGLRAMLTSRVDEGRPVGAICAAPFVLERAGLLEGREFTCHPALADTLKSPGRLDDVTVDAGVVVTSQSAGTAMPFALHLVERLCGGATRERVAEGLQYRAPAEYVV